MITVYTARIDYGWKGLNITVKSADPDGRILAPTWNIVMGLKRGEITEEEYTNRYLDLLRVRYRGNETAFLKLLEYKSLTLLCYCQPHTFCHRYLAVDVLEKIAVAKGIGYRRGGEIYAMHIR